MKRGRAHLKKPVPKQALERLYVEEQKSTKELASIFCVSTNTIRMRLKEYGIKIRRSSGRPKVVQKEVKKKTYRCIWDVFDVENERQRKFDAKLSKAKKQNMESA